MRVRTEKSEYDVTINHYEEEFRNRVGEARKTVTAVNINTGKTYHMDTFENPVLETEVRDFLEEHDL